MEKSYINNIRVRAVPAVKIWSIADCNKCFAIIIAGLNETIRGNEVTIKKMLTTEVELNARLERLEKELISAQHNNEELKRINNAFRSIGWADNPTQYEDNVSIFIASHSVSFDQLSIDTRIRALSYHQKMTEFFAVSLQKSRSKEEVKVRVSELASEANKSAINAPSARKDSWVKFDKFIEGIAKGSKCSKNDAMKMAEIMGMKKPEGYSVT